jgi:hypothetical protein
MVTDIRGEVEKRQSPEAPLGDKAVIRYRTDTIFGNIFDYPRIDIPEEMLLGSLRDGRLRVISPLKVKISHEGKHAIAEAVELDEFGFGANVSEAIVDLQRTIAELYFTLEKEQKRLGVDLQRIWGVLQEKILKR